MFVQSRLRWCRAFGAMMLTLLSGGCVAYSDPGYGYYGGPYYGGGVVAFGDDWHDGWRHGHHDWDDHHGWRHDWDDHHGWRRS